MNKAEKYLREWYKRNNYFKRKFGRKRYIITAILTFATFSVISLIFSKVINIYNPYIKWGICYPLLIIVTLIFQYKYLYEILTIKKQGGVK